MIRRLIAIYVAAVYLSAAVLAILSTIKVIWGIDTGV